MSHFQDVDTRNSDSDEDGITIAGPDHFHSRRWHTDLHRIPRQVFRQLFGYKPFKTSYFALYRPLDDYQSRAILGLAVLLSIAAGIPLPLVGVLFSHAINDFPPPEDQLEVILKQLLGVAVAYFVVTWGWSICWGIVGERVARRTREALMKKALAMGVSDLETHAPDVSSMITSGTQSIQSGTSEKVGLFIQSISYFVAAFVVGFIISAKLTGILFAAVIPIMAVTVTCGTMAVSRFSRRASKTLEAAASVAEGAISAVKTVQAFGAGEALAEKHLKILKAAEEVGSKKAFAGGIMLGCVFFIAYAANALAFKIGSQIAGHGGAGSVYAVVFLILDASFVLGQVGPFIQTLALAASAGSTILDFLNLPTPDININASEGITIDAEAWTGNLELRDVTFAYPSRKNVTILDNVSLSFKVGTTTGLVGLSGSGKSTIASLLLRFYDPDMGLITLDGLEIKQADLKSWRANIALVDQEPVLATGTILENIASGLLDETSLSKEDILARCITAAKRANAYFVFDLPQGIHTRVGPSGNTSLSGGQKQRICLARAIVRNPSLLILDEPTSALDTTSEKLILQSLQDLQSTGCSIIMIAHRLATIKDMDNIVVFGGGRVLEQGAHQTLIELSGAYKGLVEAQSLECTEEEMSQESVKPDAPDAKLEHKLKDPSAMPSDVETDSTWSDVTVAVGDDNLIQNSQPTWRLVKRCLSLSRPEALFLVAGCIASGMSGSLIVGESIVFGNLVGLLNVQSNESDYGSQVSKFCLIFFALSLIALFAYTTSTTFFGVSSERLVRRVRDRSLRTILRQDIAWFANPKNSTHALTAKMNTDCSHLNGLSGPIIGAVASVSVSIIGGIVLAFIIAWKIAIVLLSVVPVMVLSGFTRLRVLSKSEKRLETAYTEAAVVASEACSQMRTVTAYGREAAIFQKFRSALEKPYKQSYKFNAVTNFFLAFSLAITYFAYTLAYWWGAKLVREGTYTQKQFFIVLPALLFSAQAAGQVFSVAPELARAKSAAHSIFSLFDQRPSILIDDLEAKSIDSSSTGISNEKAPSGSIKFDSVTFGYGNDPTELVLKNVSCEIQAGEFVGVVGPSGAGKSSFISLLERFYDPTEGSIILNGRNIRQVPVLEYRSTLGLVSQEPDLFAGSISFNISLGAKPGHEVTQEEIEAVCKRIGLHEFIVSLPTGYNTECGVNGSKLSGGQKQRVAIARALIRKPDVLLLDEATAALDAHSEQQVQEAVAASIGAGQTTVVVAHRLSTVRRADRIFVMDRGEIVGVGSHAELVQSNALYRELVHVQEIG